MDYVPTCFKYNYLERDGTGAIGNGNSQMPLSICVHLLAWFQLVTKPLHDLSAGMWHKFICSFSMNYFGFRTVCI